LLPMARELLRKVRDLILKVIDFFYPPFSRFLPKHTFRYLACGGCNTLLDIFLYYVSYHFILHKQEISVFGLLNISPHIMAFIIGFSITFPLGFTLSKYIVFSDSQLKGRIQLFRYVVLVILMLSMNYLFLKLFVDVLNFYPTLAKIVTTVIVAIFSYISQRNFSFKPDKSSARQEADN
jgi:putative flippase GtrA